MPITDADIRLLKSERLTDADDGGGRITGNEVVDGQSNNLFADVSDLDRTVGRVSLRKAYPAVVSLNTDAYLGVHAIIDDAPDDPNVSAVIFTTGSWTDDRADARDQLERFVVRGPLYPGFLYDTQIVGARAITLFQSVAQDPPAVGDVLSLINAEGTAGEQEQYIRLTAVEFEDRTFTDASGSFQRRIVTCEISDPLRVTFAGAPINRRDDITPTARVRQTLVADAARYYGVSPTVGAAAPNDLTVQVTSITAPLVPSAQGETPVVNAIAGGEAPALVAAGPALTRTYPSKQAGGTVALYLSGPVMPGSVMIQLGGTVWTDSGRGTLVRSGVDDATIDYATGSIRFASGLAATTGTVSATFVPAASLARVRNSISVPITLSTRGYNYVATLAPVPAPGNLVVDYLSGNRRVAGHAGRPAGRRQRHHRRLEHRPGGPATRGRREHHAARRGGSDCGRGERVDRTGQRRHYMGERRRKERDSQRGRRGQRGCDRGGCARDGRAAVPPRIVAGLQHDVHHQLRAISAAGSGDLGSGRRGQRADLHFDRARQAGLGSHQRRCRAAGGRGLPRERGGQRIGRTHRRLRDGQHDQLLLGAGQHRGRGSSACGAAGADVDARPVCQHRCAAERDDLHGAVQLAGQRDGNLGDQQRREHSRYAASRLAGSID
ncbi:MAG: hypothetical protein LW835_17810 [Burkholderiaceae bacterium]|nr:hypothetical protein [Burkholderiaceae bacterium]